MFQQRAEDREADKKLILPKPTPNPEELAMDERIDQMQNAIRKNKTPDREDLLKDICKNHMNRLNKTPTAVRTRKPQDSATAPDVGTALSKKIDQILVNGNHAVTRAAAGHDKDAEFNQNNPEFDLNSSVNWDDKNFDPSNYDPGKSNGPVVQNGGHGYVLRDF